jgi:hypothetical protein
VMLFFWEEFQQIFSDFVGILVCQGNFDVRHKCFCAADA